jgi:hypothetical protein
MRGSRRFTAPLPVPPRRPAATAPVTHDDVRRMTPAEFNAWCLAGYNQPPPPPPPPPRPLPRPIASAPTARIAATDHQPQPERNTTTVNDMTELQELRTAFVQTLMRMEPHQLVNWNGRRQPAAEILKQMLKGEGAEINSMTPQTAAHAISPTEEALAGLTPEARARLEAGEGPAGLLAPHKSTINTRQDDGSHGTTRVSFHFNEEGKVEPGVTPESQKGQLIKPVIGTEVLSGATRVRIVREQ